MNLFDDPDTTFQVPVGDEGQHSPWPAFAAVPDGWNIAHDGNTREARTARTEENRPGPRPGNPAEAGRG